MPINIMIHESGKYFITRWKGKIYDAEMVPLYKVFYAAFEKSHLWTPEFPELADLTMADFSEVTSSGMSELALWISSYYKRHGIYSKKTAVLTSENSRTAALFYEYWTSDSPENIRFFNSREEAAEWLTNQT